MEGGKKGETVGKESVKEKRGEGKEPEERAIVTTASAAQRGYRWRVEEGGRCLAPEIRALTHHRLLSLGFSRTQLVRFITVQAGANIYPGDRIIHFLSMMHLYSKHIASAACI